MPSLRGPCLCGQRFSMAKTWSSWVRNTAILPDGVLTHRAPRRGMAEIVPISIHSLMGWCPPQVGSLSLWERGLG
ncbi:hypothetical protein D3C87_1988190 [compost metagenome]